MIETCQTTAVRVDSELHSLLLAVTNKEWPVQYVGQVECCVFVCVCVAAVCERERDFEVFNEM